MSEGRNITGRVVFIVILLIAGIGGYLLFTSISVRQANIDFHSGYRTLAFNAVLIAGALAAGRLPGLFLDASWEEKLGPATLAISYILAGFGVWRGLGAFTPQASVMSGLSLVCLTVALALAASRLAIYLERREFGGVFSGIFAWVANNGFLVALIAACVTTYALLIRPAYMGKSTYSVLLEWMIILFLGIIIFVITRFRVGRKLVEEGETAAPDWHRHRQQVQPKPDTDYVQMSSLERRFIEESDQTMLVHAMISLLSQNGVKEYDIARILSPLIRYRGYGMHILRKHDAKGQSQEERGRLLKDTVTEMQSVVQPSRFSRYVKETADMLERNASSVEPKTLSALAGEFLAEGDCSRLLVRLSLLLTSAGTRTEYIDDTLRPFVTYNQSTQSGRRERERIWHDIIARATHYVPKLSLKE